jgi:hypothetical protein
MSIIIMQKNRFFFIGLLAVILAVYFPGCKTKTDDFVLDYKYEYFPLDSGRYWIWEVDSIIFEPLGSGFVRSDTMKLYIKEVVESIFIDNSGRPTARIERYQSYTEDYNWFITDVWFANRTQKTGEKIEENLRFVKLLFPPKKNQKWNGNQYIQFTENIEWLKDWVYEVTALDAPATFNATTFDSTITIMQRDSENLIAKTFATETYAINVGLVYREWSNLEKTRVTEPWTNPEKGFILKMTIKEYGN